MMNKKQKFEILTTSKEKKYEKAQFKFALLCAERTITKETTQEVIDFFHFLALMRISEDFGSIEHLKDAEYQAAGRAADRAVYRAADRAANWAAYWVAYWAADRSAYQSANWAADWAAYWAANWAADRAAEREMQYDIAEYCFDEVDDE